MTSFQRSTRSLVGAILALTFGSACFADAITGSFNVNVKLTNPGLCLSETFSQQTGAAVHVVCESSQFVSIDPRPGRPFLGVHGGAFRYFLGPSNVLASHYGGIANPFIGTGTVTEFRILSADTDDGPLEILISF